jgi:cytochrome c556
MRFVVLLAVAAFLLRAQSAEYHVVASSKQIMAGIQKPAMDSLAAMLKAGGPQDDKEWEIAERQAAILAETAQLLMMGTRPLDQDVWVKSSQRLREVATASAKAAEAKDLNEWKASLASMGQACKSCHNVHKKQKPQ